MTKAALATAVLIATAACASGGTSTSANTPNVIAGAPSCPSAEAQDLTFSGGANGHVACSTAPASCTRPPAAGGAPSGMLVPINARVGASAILFVISFYGLMTPDVPLGTYKAGTQGDDPATRTPVGATLDGIGHWETATADRGNIVVSVFDPAGAAGTVDIRLSSRNNSSEKISVRGSWKCVKAAGF